MNSFRRIYITAILCLCSSAPALAQYESFSATDQLTIAVVSNKIEDVKKALAMKGVDINAKDDEGVTPLMKAVAGSAFSLAENSPDPVDIVKLLIDKGADVNAKSKDGYTPLLIICSESCALNSEQSVRAARLLIEKGAAINFNRVIYDMNEGTPLTNAIKNAKTDLAKLLVEKGANVNAKALGNDNPLIILLGDTSGKTTEATKIKLVQILIAKGANPSQANDSRETAKSIAKNMNSKGITDALNGKTIAVNEEKKATIVVGGMKVEVGGNSQLAAVCAYGNLDNLKSAIANGGEVNAVNDDGKTPIEMLCHLLTLSMMRDMGSVRGSTKDMVAERVKMISYIIEKGSQLNSADGSHSALYNAVANGILLEGSGKLTTEDYLPIIQLLLDKGAMPEMNIPAQDVTPLNSPLNYAASKGNLKVTKLMLSKVKNINSGKGFTPLAAAIYGNGADNRDTPKAISDRLQILRLMIAKGANVNLASNGVTPLELANRMKNKEMVQELIKAGAK